MRLTLRRATAALLVMLIATGCRHKQREIHRSVYYWQTAFNLSDAQTKQMQDMGIATIYTRFFDVAYDLESKAAKPVADIRFDTKPLPGLKIIPVVFIRNKVFENASIEECAGLAEKICRRINLIADSNGQEKPKEMQIDCDWTVESKTKFFTMLTACKKNMPGLVVSCTIRLHQVKYFKSCGVPPVDRGMLMFYNMGSLTTLNEVNSIYDPKVAVNYLVNFESYPLPLDVALPVFSLAVLYHNNKPVNTVTPEITSNYIFEQRKYNLFMADRDTFIDFNHIYAGDMVKVESVGPYSCAEAAKQIAPYLQSNQFTVSIFDLQPATFFKYDTSVIAQIYNAFR